MSGSERSGALEAAGIYALEEKFMTETPSGTGASAPTPAAEQPKAADKGKNDLLLKAGIGAAIGSAAIVAALLYANRPGKKDERS